MLLMARTLLLSILLLYSVFTSAQGHHNHENHMHDDAHKYHIGVGVATAHFKGEPGLSPAAHLHFIRQVGHSNHWGLGLGYEAIFDQHLHSGLNLLVNYHPLNRLSINAGPGIVFSEHKEHHEVNPSFHTEAVYEFNLNKIHIGPMAGFGFDKEDTHFSLGVHLGFGI